MSDLIEKLSNLRSQFNCFDENERDAYNTLSEAIKVITEQPESCEDTVSRRKLLNDLKKLKIAWKKYPVMAEQIKGVETAIEYVEMIPSVAPKQEPCDDAVSRESVSKWLKQYGQDVIHGKYKFSLMYIWKNLMDLPSVTPKRKTGKWIHSDFSHEFLHCSECGRGRHFCSNFCPNCGADMQQREENK